MLAASIPKNYLVRWGSVYSMFRHRTVEHHNPGILSSELMAEIRRIHDMKSPGNGKGRSHTPYLGDLDEDEGLRSQCETFLGDTSYISISPLKASFRLDG